MSVLSLSRHWQLAVLSTPTSPPLSKACLLLDHFARSLPPYSTSTGEQWGGGGCVWGGGVVGGCEVGRCGHGRERRSV